MRRVRCTTCLDISVRGESQEVGLGGDSERVTIFVIHDSSISQMIRHTLSDIFCAADHVSASNFIDKLRRICANLFKFFTQTFQFHIYQLDLFKTKKRNISNNKYYYTHACARTCNTHTQSSFNIIFSINKFLIRHFKLFSSVYHRLKIAAITSENDTHAM